MDGDVTGFMVIAVLLWFVMAGFGTFVAVQKNRPQEEGFLLGLLFGPFGVLIEALLPTLDPPPAIVKTPEQIDAEIAAERQRDAEHEEWEAEWERKKKEIEARYEAQREATIELQREMIRKVTEWALVVVRWFWRQVVCFGWFRMIPGTLQPILIGIVIALPVAAIIIVMARYR